MIAHQNQSLKKETSSPLTPAYPSLFRSIQNRCSALHNQNAYLFGINTTFTSGLSGFGLDEKVDEEQDGKESSERNSQVSTELNLKGNRVGGEAFNDRVHGKGRGSGREGNSRGGGLDSSLGDCVVGKRVETG